MFFCSLNEPDHPAQSPQGATESNYFKTPNKGDKFLKKLWCCVGGRV